MHIPYHRLRMRAHMSRLYATTICVCVPICQDCMQLADLLAISCVQHQRWTTKALSEEQAAALRDILGVPPSQDGFDVLFISQVRTG